MSDSTASPASLRTRARGAGAWGALRAALWLGGLGTVAWLLWQGWDYYATPIAQRARHPDYWTLKPGGSRGLAYGLAGTAMMVTMHVYTVRRRLRPLRRLGPLSAWLDFHILLGVMGPLFIVLHSSFKVGGLIAISFWSMVAVALSGLLGRYLYVQIPRTRAGDAVQLADVERADRELGRWLGEEFGLDAPALARLAELARPPGQGYGAPRLLLALLLHDLDPRPRWRLRAFLARHRVPPALAREFRRTVEDKVRLERRLRLWDGVHGLFHYWHVAHKPFAIVMYLFLAVHIWVATATGYAFR